MLNTLLVIDVQSRVLFKFLYIFLKSNKVKEVYEMPRINTTSIINVLRSTFARFGLPIEVVSIQGPPFKSCEFQSFF